jgi:iron(III) transport system ATP-binding protein
MTTLRFEGIGHAYGSQAVLEGLDVEIRSGELFTLLGPSGCGKTTLLRIAAGFVRPLRGRVHFDRDDVTDVPPYRRNTGMVFQDYALFPDRSVRENVAFGLRARRVPEADARRRVDDILGKFGLAPFADRGPANLSGGQRQRVAMARALVIEPRLLLLDEPLSALDAKLRIEFRGMIQQIQRDFGITTLFVTHDQEEALSISDRIALMHEGRLAQVGTPAEIYDSPDNRFAADFIGAANILPAAIVERGAATVTCDVEGERVSIAARGVKVRAGEDRAVLCVRPESWRLDEHGAGGLRGEIVSIQFLGTHVSYGVRLASGAQVRCSTPHRAGEPARPLNAPVCLQVPPDALLLAA